MPVDQWVSQFLHAGTHLLRLINKKAVFINDGLSFER